MQGNGFKSFQTEYSYFISLYLISYHELVFFRKAVGSKILHQFRTEFRHELHTSNIYKYVHEKYHKKLYLKKYFYTGLYDMIFFQEYN